MKKVFYLFALLALCAPALPLAAADEAAPDAALTATFSAPEEVACPGAVAELNFPEPMVTPETVGSAVGSDLLSLSQELPFDAVWISTSAIRITLHEAAAPMSVLRVALKAEGLRSLAGHPVAGGELCIPEHRYFSLNSSYFAEPGHSVFFSAADERHDAALAAAVPKAYWALERYEDAKPPVVLRREPALVRPLTVAEALQEWEKYEQATDWSVTEEDRRELEKRDGCEVLPYLWAASAYSGSVGVIESAMLYLPGIGHYDEEKQAYGDAEAAELSLPEFQYMMSNTRVGEGEYKVNIHFTQPLSVESAKECLKALPFSILSLHKGEEEVDLTMGEDGAYRGATEYGSIVLTPQTEKTLKGAVSYPVGDGEAVGVKNLYFHAKVTGERLRLSMDKPFTSLYGAEITETDLQYYGRQDRDYTLLAPKRPYIHSDMLVNNMDRSGDCVLRCRYRSLQNMKVRVHRVEADSPQAALLLGKYSEKYSPASDNYRFTWEGRYDTAPSALPEELWALLPHEVRTIELPEEAGEAEIDLKKLFGADTQGLFFVDAGGDTHPEWQKGGKEYNQGLIQLTNLGLMWKVSGKSLFAYAYHLSDGKPVADAKLRLLNKDAETLAELPVKDGFTAAALPEGLTFMQLAEGADCYTTTAKARDCDISADRCYYMDDEVAVPADLMPEPQVFLFADRNVYRPGETAHIKGMLRFLTGNELSNPGLESVKITIGDEEDEVLDITPAEDGSFTADVPLPRGGKCRIEATCTVKGDADYSSPDFAVLKRFGLSYESFEWRRAENARRERIYVTVSDFRRNAFEVKSAVTVNPEKHTATVTAAATAFTGAPVAQGRVEWRTYVRESNFYPEQYGNYYFGDYREGDARDDFYDAYYGGGTSDARRCDTYVSEGALDGAGQGSLTVGLRSSDFPSPTEVSVCTSVTDGNEQTIKDVATATWHPGSVYAGISNDDAFCPAGGTMTFRALLVGADEKAYEGAPCKAKLTVKRKAVHNYRYGAKAKTDVHSSTEWVTVQEREILLSGSPQELGVPAAEAGEYLLDIDGTDAEGKRFRTAVTRYVWGGDEAPWSVESGTDMQLITSADVYKPGDTAKVLVLTPVDGEVLITMERGGVLRHFRRTVTVAKPVVEIPVAEEDAPVVYVSAFLVQTGEKNRRADGMPLQKLGTAQLHVLPVHNILQVALDAPQSTLRPGQECTVGGVVTDADGKPVANASVTLFAEDEGVLQVCGYELPDPLQCFMGDRAHGVTSYSSLNQLLGEDLAKRDFGNKGVFIGGGGGDDEYDDLQGAKRASVREDFAPCALWLADIKTDAQGRFSATYKNPDTLTRYRLMAVTAAGADRFGKGQASYTVDTPVRVEPSAPLTAVVGDELLLPATVSMNVKDIPAAAAGQELTWKVTLSGTPNAKLPQPTAAVTLAGAAPKTVLQPVMLTEAGDCKLTWRVQGTGEAAQESDAAAFGFTVRPPMPFLREAVCAVIEPGKSACFADWLKGDFAKNTEAELTFSTGPLSGAADGLRYLITYPHGCVEQLSSALLPWVFKGEFEQAVGLRYPQGRHAESVVAETVEKIQARQLDNGFFAYWQGGNANRNFSPYAALVLEESCVYWPGKRNAAKALREELLEVPDANLVGLYFLARSGFLDNKVFDAVRKLRVNPNETELWLLALCAQILEHPEADALAAAARKAKGTGSFRYGLPSAAAAETLWAIEKAPNSPATATQLRRYVESVAQNAPTTWECGWMCLAMHHYIRKTELQDKTATVNGHPVSMETPLRLTAKLGDATAFRAAGNPVYVSATVEGYTAKKQPEKMIDKGFAVTRRYEKLNEDGTWSPTGTFRVCDVVRVTLTAKHTDKLPAVYMVLEDRLPAAFEAVNPALTTQALPECVRTDENSRGGSGFINNREYGKDCVRFYVTRWGEGELTARYIARVVKSGKVTAPAAKAELMYRPQVYGLAIPQHFTVLPR